MLNLTNTFILNDTSILKSLNSNNSLKVVIYASFSSILNFYSHDDSLLLKFHTCLLNYNFPYTYDILCSPFISYIRSLSLKTFFRSHFMREMGSRWQNRRTGVQLISKKLQNSQLKAKQSSPKWTRNLKKDILLQKKKRRPHQEVGRAIS